MFAIAQSLCNESSYHHLTPLADIIAIEYAKPATIIPIDHNRTDIVNANYCSLCPLWWSLRVKHSHQLNPTAHRITLSQSLQSSAVRYPQLVNAPLLFNQR